MRVALLWSGLILPLLILSSPSSRAEGNNAPLYASPVAGRFGNRAKLYVQDCDPARIRTTEADSLPENGFRVSGIATKPCFNNNKMTVQEVPVLPSA